jgi:hypothetical protein
MKRADHRVKKQSVYLLGLSGVGKQKNTAKKKRRRRRDPPPAALAPRF